MVRPYLNKFDHEEFLAQYKLERNRRIKKITLFSTLVAILIGTSAYFIFSNNSTSSSSYNLPAYIGGEESPKMNAEKRSETSLLASKETAEEIESDLEQNELVSRMDEEVSDEDFKALQAEVAARTRNSVQESKSNLGTTRGNESISVKNEDKKTTEASTSTPVVKVIDNTQRSNAPAEVIPAGQMRKNPELTQVDETPLFSAEKMPKFPGGYSALKRFIKTRLQMPKEAKKNKVNGTVQVQFIVNSGGTISNARVSKGLGYGCDEAAIALVRDMPKWIPGEQDGKAVAVYYNLPVKFSNK